MNQILSCSAGENPGCLVGDDCMGSPHDAGAEDISGDDAARFIHETDSHLRPAEIHADGQSLLHHRTRLLPLRTVLRGVWLRHIH